MSHKDINNINEAGKIYLLIMAFVVGVTHYLKRNIKDKKVYERIFLFIYDCLASGSISVFTGLITYYMYGNLGLALGVGGMLGHMGTRTLSICEEYIRKQLNVTKK